MKHKIFVTRYILPVLFFAAALVMCLEFGAEAKTVSTENGEWKWEYWTSAAANGKSGTYSFARCVNKSTGKSLPAGWNLIDGSWYYVTATGLIRDQFHGGYKVGDKMGAGTYTKGSKQQKYGWVKTKKGYRYGIKKKSKYLKNRIAWIDSELYLFTKNGYLPSPGWYEQSGKWYYIEKNGTCAVGWKKVSGSWFFFDRCSGNMVEQGAYDTRAPFARYAKYYVFTKGGARRRTAGWQKGLDGYWYRSKADGKAVTGWQTVGGKSYYFVASLGCRMAASRKGLAWYQDGRHLKKSGVAEPMNLAWHNRNGYWWYGRGSKYMANEMVCINGWVYLFNEKGYCTRGWDFDHTQEITYITESEAEDQDVITWNDPIEVTNEELLLMSAVVYLEAGGEPYRGQLAVANVILNRLRSGRYGTTLADVIYAPYQFSVVGTKTFEKMIKTGGSESAMKATKEALKGKNNIGTYVSFRMVSRYDITKLTDYKIIKNHVFFTEN